ncbi:MAG TPA: DUF4349 domain-containing protein [Spirochaetales bacterium]|nr:DUF4349 domain-containing protein [Spirochaetales bacterium]
MKLLLCILLINIVPGSILPAEEADNFLYHHLRATLLVADPAESGDLISRWAESKGGYFLLKSENQVVIRFPFNEIKGLRELFADISERIIEITPGAVDLREQILGLQSGIRSRESILKKNLSFIDRADVAGTLAIEREVNALLQEIESLKGTLRKLNTDRRLARGEIYLSFREQSLPQDIPSSFDWINTIDFYKLMQEGF